MSQKAVMVNFHPKFEAVENDCELIYIFEAHLIPKRNLLHECWL